MRTIRATFILVVVAASGIAEAKAKYNSQLAMPNNLVLGDVDGDAATDFIQFASNRLLVSHSDFGGSPIAHRYLSREISRVFVGDFLKKGRDQVCAVLWAGLVWCVDYNASTKTLNFVSRQAAFVGNPGSGDEILVGDYDGNGYDDVMIFNSTSGSLSLYTMASTLNSFTPLAFTLGNLSDNNLAGKQLRVGEFNQTTTRRDDLLVWDPYYRQLLLYTTANDGNGNTTFWWNFSTASDGITSSEDFSVANLDGGNNDSIVARDRTTGAYRFLQATTYLPAVNNVSQGQLAVVTAPGSNVFFGKLRGNIDEPGGTLRDDALVYDAGNTFFYRDDARWDGAQLTFWWAYSKGVPANDQTWPVAETDKWLFLLCKTSDLASYEPNPLSYYQKLLRLEGEDMNGLYDYFRDVSYGQKNIGFSDVKGWYTMSSISSAQVGSTPRETIWTACKNAANIDVTPYLGTVVLLNANGQPSAMINTQKAVMMMAGSIVTTIAHEMLHMYGLGHSFDQNNVEYGDKWDVMSAARVWTFDVPAFDFVARDGVTYPGLSGPELNAPYKHTLGYFPGNRVVQLMPDASTWQTTTVTLAAYGRPEAPGALAVTIPAFSTGSDMNHYYTIEFRNKDGGDRGIPRDTVMLHERWPAPPGNYYSGVSYLYNQPDAEWLPGENFNNGDINVAVDSYDATSSTAVVTITY